MEKVNVNYEKLYYGFPVILVSYYDRNGHPNVTPISSSYTLKDMVVLGFNGKGYAIHEIKEVRDFVINVPDRTLEHDIDFCGTHTGFESKKFEQTKLTPVPAQLVHAPAIEECPIVLECTVTDVIEKDYFHGITNVMAKIKGRYIAKDYLDHAGRLQPSKMNHLIYIGDGKVKGYRYLEEANSVK